MTELGQTTDPKELVPGEPELISNDLRALVGNVKQVAGIGSDLGSVDVIEWTGEAASAFRGAFGEEPPKWLQAVEDLGSGGNELANFGDALTWAQGEAQRAIEAYAQAMTASRVAAADYNLLAQAGQMLAPFVDPGQGLAADAQTILASAREQLETAGGAVALAFGFEPDGEGGYSNTLRERSFGADNRTTRDPETGLPVEQEQGWHKGKGGKSYAKEFGTQPEGVFGDMLNNLIGDTLKDLGIEIPEWEGKAEAGVEVWKGELSGEFESGPFSGKGEMSAAVLGAGAEAHAGVSQLGLTAGASAEAYLAKAAASGEVNLGEHASLSGEGEVFVGGKAEAGGTLGWTGGEVNAEAFVGARAEGSLGAEVAGVGAGVNGEAWAGVGAEASGQFGMGDDGKFHIGGSVGVALGVGGKVGFDVAIDPGEVVDTVSDVAGDIGDGIGNAAGAVGDFLGV